MQLICLPLWNGHSPGGVSFAGGVWKYYCTGRPHRREHTVLVSCIVRSDHGVVGAGDAHARLAAAQLNAITALEGLLPQLPPGIALGRLVSPQPSAVGPEQPSVLVATLLQPDCHAPASTQHRNRVAALLLQVIDRVE